MNLQEFLNANRVDNITKEIIVSERFKDENGNLLKFKIKPISQKELGILKNKHTSYSKKGKLIVDSSALTVDLIINCTVEPDFKDSRSINDLGVVTSEQYIDKVLLAGEITTLEQAIMKISGFGQDMSELIEQAKN